MTIAALRSPIILVHGFLGYGHLRMAGVSITNYFPNISESLEAAGNRVHMPWLSATGGVADRAAQLKRFITREVGQEPVHLIAHSMGGLDSRYMISKLDMAEHVLSLTTLGTPHRGTCLADWGIFRLERLVKPVLNWIGVPTQGFYDLTRGNCAVFNREVTDMPGVRYYSVVGIPQARFLNPQLIPTHMLVHAEEGPNDGIVSEASARYGERVDVWDRDHLGLVNWQHLLLRTSTAADLSPQYGTLVSRLADEGF